VGQDRQVAASALYHAYGEWCKETGEKPLSKTAFGLRLAERGFAPVRAHAGRLWQGIGLCVTRLEGETAGGGVDPTGSVTRSQGRLDTA
jgi:phage/plasmid-associated DNA primase